ncbi:MAG: hypothetical protein GY894_06150 [Planctomycetes bacterium]|nr:hypothetical protein [Planctomycetota bacterium]
MPMVRIALLPALMSGAWCIAGDLAAPPRMGEALEGLAPSQLERFELGRIQFERNITVDEGLGPVFNQTSCASCHNAPVGGPGAQQVTRFGRLDKKGGFDPLASLGGSLFNANAISEECADEIPASANVTSLRVTPGALGYGLLEAIPDDDLVANAASQDVSVRGVIRWTEAIELPGIPRVGRFGWKAQLATIMSFSADASNQEIGFTTRLLPNENPPKGDENLLAECDDVPDPEDVADAEGFEFLDRVTDFQRFLAAPPQSPASGMTGETIFGAVGCSSCHTPSFTTSDDPNLEMVLRDRTIRPYSDFLLHDMGAAADGIADGPAGVRELRTPPLWGVRIRNPMWHDGRVLGGTFGDRIREAITLHGAALSQGQAAESAFGALSAGEQDALIAFLDSLGRAAFDGDGDGDVDLGDFYGINGFIECLGSDISSDDPCAVHDLDGDGDVDLNDAEAMAMDYDDGWYDCDDDGSHDLVQIAADPTLDANQDGELDVCQECPADIDGSGDVGTDDLLTVLSEWGPCASGCDGDIDGDLVVGVDDVLMLVGSWGPCD